MALSICGNKTNQDGKELTRHGASLFPVTCYQDELSENSIGWHWHEEFEFIIVQLGAIEVNIENEKIIISRGEGLFINSGVLHAIYNARVEESSLRSIVFHPRLIGSIDSIFWQKLVQPITHHSLFRYIHFDSTLSWHPDLICSIKTAWKTIAEENEEFENIARYHLTHSLHLLFGNQPAIVTGISGQERLSVERMKAMLQYIEEHYREDLTVAVIANSISVSESVCSRCFRQITGTTPIQYIKQFRIEKAAEQLLTTNKKVIEIGSECGFPDISYFTKSFREQKGCTPIQYRKSHRK